MSIRKPLDGQKFGRVLVLSSFRENGRTKCWCRCSCGITFCSSASNINGGQVTSCGCARIQRIQALNLTHGECKKSQEYASWRAMNQRCRDPNHTHYANYGGRGIEICLRWAAYANFLEDMGRKPSSSHSLDRINGDGNYEPSNCRWATRSQQMKNRRPFKRTKMAKEVVDATSN